MGGAGVAECCKSSCIVPVPKKSTVSVMNDLPPVALTSAVMEVFERLVLCKLQVLVSPFIDPIQFAGRPKPSIRVVRVDTGQPLEVDTSHTSGQDENVQQYTLTTSARCQDAAIYRCEASNDNGTDEESVKLQVNCAPTVTEELQLLTDVSTVLFITSEKPVAVMGKNHSVETAVLIVMDGLLVHSDERLVSLMALLDLSAVFDTLDHSAFDKD
nr:hypothetical protein BaRGS_019620 [Batillaria attramentaria]